MLCLELSIPPLPVLVMINKVNFPKSYSHLDRVFHLYDIIIVRRGTLYMTEDGIPYEISENQMLVLEPGKRHYSHIACQQDTLVYYLHVQHPPAQHLVPAEEIRWHAILPISTYKDHEPQEHVIYLPKFKELNTGQLWSLLDDLIELHNRSELEKMLPLQIMFGQLLIMLQNFAKSSHNQSSRQLCDDIIAYLGEQSEKPFRLEEMAKALHFSIDYISKCLKKHTGLTPLQYMNRIRIQKARNLLEHSDLSLREISLKVGIPDMNYFFRLFRKHVGMPPAKYRSSLYAETAECPPPRTNTAPPDKV
ncbi:AraC family transcriptional regulator [Paenibacillus sp. HWE-109]|uniref:helix-turn-helix transcriptional regulator n=1 Tax=Paenibacillus sp. HWE-109 TaxID=1306526 RepID=UPI001EE0C90C|nr:helix-turn-helix domain-containing protein [Paenibacillus sp. HWE-109]UKS28626.1 AraC family transcriptional regulator [Paenibacillus sp. HWE-109]